MMELRDKKPGDSFQDRIASVLAGRNGRGRYVVERPVGMRREWTDDGACYDVPESHFQGYEFQSEVDVDRFIMAQSHALPIAERRFETEAEAREWLGLTAPSDGEQ